MTADEAHPKTLPKQRKTNVNAGDHWNLRRLADEAYDLADSLEEKGSIGLAIADNGRNPEFIEICKEYLGEIQALHRYMVRLHSRLSRLGYMVF